MRRLEEDRDSGRTFLVATHSLPFVEERCDRAALLMEGRIVALGSPREVVRQYRELLGPEARTLAARLDES
jgi:ABC-type polysaccharide/polyol phosphate transport system ATPase subunit